MSVKIYFLALVSAAAAFPSFPWPSWGSGKVQPFVPVFNKLFGGPLTPQILKAFEEPNIANIARNSYIVREGSELKLNGDRYTASGANVYWLGLDENIIPPAGEPFYAPFNASYPTFERISEVMKTLVTMGAKTIRSQTLGVSTGNPLSLMPDLGIVNQEAFKTIDWSVYQARQHGLRLVIPLTDSYVS
jgi:mannan endo-1,4-beta-mannosidase